MAKYYQAATFRRTLYMSAVFVVFLLWQQFVYGETSTPRLVSHTFQDGQLSIKLSDGAASLTLYSENSIEVVYTTSNSTPALPSYAIGTTPRPVL